MTLTVVKTTALTGTITNAQLAGGIDLTSKVTGTLPIANGGTNSTATTFVNATTNVTGALPIVNGGTGATSFSPGKIAQVVHSKNTTYRNVNNNTLVTCMSVTITPSATSSKILILGSPNLSKDTNSTAVIHKCFRVVGGSDVATQVLSDHSARNNSSTVYNDIGYAAFQWYDEPSSTAAITYDYRIASQGNNANIAFNNYSSAGNFSSQITAMEILA